MFDSHLLDMAELAVENAKTMAEFASGAGAVGGAAAESKPVLLFHGEWEHSASLSALKSLLLDFFANERVEALSPIGIQRAIAFTVESGGENPKILMRHYAATLKKSAEGTSPYVHMTEIGPSLDLRVRRTHQPAPDLLKEAMRQAPASASAPKKTKNVSHSRLHGKQGRLHVHKQDLSQMATAKMKAFKKQKTGAGAAKQAADGA